MVKNILFVTFSSLWQSYGYIALKQMLSINQFSNPNNYHVACVGQTIVFTLLVCVDNWNASYHFIRYNCAFILYSAIIGRGKYWRKVYLERVVGKYLTNLHLNKTICAYIIVLKRLKIQYLKRLAQRGTSPSFYTCVIESLVVSMFEFTVNEATTSSY